MYYIITKQKRKRWYYYQYHSVLLNLGWIQVIVTKWTKNQAEAAIFDSTKSDELLNCKKLAELFKARLMLALQSQSKIES